MATLSPSTPGTGPAISLAAFRAALPPGTGEGAVADRLCAIGTGLHRERGEELPPDRHEDRLVWIASGSAKLVAPHAAAAGTAAPPGGQVLAFHFAGDLVSVLRWSETEAWGGLRLVALTPCDLVIFPADRFLDAAQADPVVLRSVLTRSLQAVHRTQTRMMQIGHKSAAARIADFLVSMAERLAGQTEGPCTFALPMSRRDIGDSLGLTIETVSRQLTELREAGLVTTEGRSGVALSDVGALARIAGRGAREEPGKI
ncbi:helix-turn-helix domain-containing protein [Erythrobacter sp. WG]|uniref:helix-turn-helix domain-containing protein n=1 Tax=Erythrobacter sp. WG TaxID=2985510 RepID=UPI00226F8615|nr:helix-turn-helix domain-containing protein [Erythrobacter sp. WG]MCX9147777.1 helix-turn-helix domain-containing protein [Erythrobacter sp. WG]